LQSFAFHEWLQKISLEQIEWVRHTERCNDSTIFEREFGVMVGRFGADMRCIDENVDHLNDLKME
jgi:hypothetical protein